MEQYKQGDQVKLHDGLWTITERENIPNRVPIVMFTLESGSRQIRLTESELGRNVR